MTSNTSVKFVEIPLGQITSNPLNPRKIFSGPKFDELVSSIRKSGVIVPIIIRPIKGSTPFEIVAGERRFRAAGVVGLGSIPTVVRELTDDEAYDFMLIENLQREDLTDLEEAESFKAYADRHGEGAVQDIAEKTGINPRYIRSRISVLTLPAAILEAWRKGALKYGHLEQLLRVQSPDRLKHFFARTKEQDLSIADLKRQISQEQIPLSAAKFDTGKACAGCRSNSAVQEDLFGVGDGETACLNPKCFKGKQGEWLKHHWLETPEAKKYGTRGARFDDDIPWNKKEPFRGSKVVPKKCLECDNFVSLVDVKGHVSNEWSDAKACVGDKRCFSQAEKAARGESRGEKAKKTAGSGPRVPWHGEYFRNLFFRKRVPAILEGLKPEDQKIKTLLVMCLAHTNHEASAALALAIGCKLGLYGYGAKDKTLFSKLLALPYAKIAPIFRAVVQAVFLEGQNVGEYNGFGSTKRRLVADFLGVNLAKEFAVTEEYLGKKTKNELVVFGKKSGLLTGAKAKDYIAKTLKKKPDALAGMKKSELISVFLKSGVELVGRVPDEITKA